MRGSEGTPDSRAQAVAWLVSDSIALEYNSDRQWALLVHCA